MATTQQIQAGREAVQQGNFTVEEFEKKYGTSFAQSNTEPAASPVTTPAPTQAPAPLPASDVALTPTQPPVTVPPVIQPAVTAPPVTTQKTPPATEPPPTKEELQQQALAQQDAFLQQLKSGQVIPSQLDREDPSVRKAIQRFNAAAAFDSMTPTQLLESIKNGDIIPSRQDSTWTALYANGQPTEVQQEAFRLWGEHEANRARNELGQDASRMYMNVSKGRGQKREESMLKTQYNDINDLMDALISDEPDAKTIAKIGILGLNSFTGQSIADERKKALNEFGILEKQSALSEINREVLAFETAEENIERDIIKEVSGSGLTTSQLRAMVANRTRELQPEKIALQNKLKLAQNDIKIAMSMADQSVDDFLADRDLQIEAFDSSLKFAREIAAGNVAEGEVSEEILNKLSNDIIGGFNKPLLWEARIGELLDQGFSPTAVEQQVLAEAKEAREISGEVLRLKGEAAKAPKVLGNKIFTFNPETGEFEDSGEVADPSKLFKNVKSGSSIYRVNMETGESHVVVAGGGGSGSGSKLTQKIVEIEGEKYVVVTDQQGNVVREPVKLSSLTTDPETETSPDVVLTDDYGIDMDTSLAEVFGKERVASEEEETLETFSNISLPRSSNVSADLTEGDVLNY